tara:strand:+ start:5050 stop:5391 length:342 start_codon:yes stop_codon:yes gene_type:complete
MTPLISLLFIAVMLCLTGAAFALIFKNLSDINKLQSKPKRRRHPELEEINEGDELLVVKFSPDWEEGEVDIKFTPDNDFTDKVLDKSLQKRIQQLNDPWDDEDDDDGDIIARV